jgi:hypothetical protein
MVAESTDDQVSRQRVVGPSRPQPRAMLANTVRKQTGYVWCIIGACLSLQLHHLALVAGGEQQSVGCAGVRMRQFVRP